MNKKIKIIRSAVGSTPSWGIIKELQKRKIEVIGIDSNPFSFGLYKLKKSYVVPKGNEPNFIEKILEIIDKEKPNAILSGPEEELLILSKNKKLIEKKGTIMLCPDYEYVKICADKKKTYLLFKDIGIPTPKLFNDKDIKFPCVIKPRFGRGASNVYIVNDFNELNVFIKKFKNDEYIIQEYIEGKEYTVDIFSDKEGNIISIVPRIRLNTESGVSVKSKTSYNKEIIDYCKIISKRLKLFGGSCIQCIKNEEGIKFIEINTRFGGGSILSIKADPTIIPNLIRIIKGEKHKPNRGFKEGLLMLRYHSEIFVNENKIKKVNL